MTKPIWFYISVVLVLRSCIMFSLSIAFRFAFYLNYWHCSLIFCLDHVWSLSCIFALCLKFVLHSILCVSCILCVFYFKFALHFVYILFQVCFAFCFTSILHFVYVLFQVYFAFCLQYVSSLSCIFFVICFKFVAFCL